MQIVTTKELAEILKVHPVTIHRWVLSGKIDVYMKLTDRDFRFNLDDVIAQLKNNNE